MLLWLLKLHLWWFAFVWCMRKCTKRWWVTSGWKKLTFLNRRALTHLNPPHTNNSCGCLWRFGFRSQELMAKICHRHFYLSAERWHVLIFYIYHSTTLKFCNKLYECGKRWFSFWGGFSCFILPFQANGWNAVMALCTVHSQRSSDVYPGVWRCFLKFVYLQTALTSFQNNFKSVLPIS